MKITLIHGPSKCGKTRFIIKKFADEFSKNPLIIAPSSESVRYIKNFIFSETFLTGFCGHRIITFDHLVNILMEGCSELSNIGKYFLLRKIVSPAPCMEQDIEGEILDPTFEKRKLFMHSPSLRAQELGTSPPQEVGLSARGGVNLKYFLPIKDYIGFYELLSRFVSELKSGEIMPEAFLKGVNEKGPAEKDKEIYAIYSAYQEELRRFNIYDHEGKFWQAQRLIDNGNLGPLSDSKLLLVDGFQNFSPAELKIINSIGKFVDEIVITLTLDHAQASAFAPTIKTYNILKNIFNNIEEKQIPAVASADRKIKIISCPGQVREIEEIAREIKRLIIHSDRRPDDIAVLFRDLAQYKELAIAIFTRYGIPYSVSEGISLIKNPVIRIALRAFEQISNAPKNAPFKEYVKLLKDLMPKEKISNELINILDNPLPISDDKIDFSFFCESILYIAESAESPKETYRGGQVQILDVHKARGLSFPVVFIGGLIEKSFPKQIAEEPLYGDIERIELRKYGVDVEESKEKQKEEMFLFYTAVNTAQECLYLTYPATDAEGKEELTSYYIDEIKKIHPDKIDEKKVHLADVVPKYQDVYKSEDLITRIMCNYHSNLKDDLTMTLYKHLNIDRLSKIAVVENDRQSAYNGIITDEKALNKIKKDYGADYKFSVSQFNEYGTCPFSYFAKRLLGLEPIEELEDEIEPSEEGKLYHEILRESYAPSPALRAPLPKGERVKEIAEKYFKLTEQKGLIKNIYLWKIKKEEIIKNINNVIQYEANEPPPLGIKRTPAHFEIPFGMDEKEPLVINGIKIQGIIDRIDLTESGLFVVVDYKSGGKLISANDILKGTNIQLPIYIMAAKDALDIGVDALEAYLLYIKRRKYFHASPLIHYKNIRGKLKPNPSWNEYMSIAKKYVIEYAKGIRDGKFPPLPKDECPSYCDYNNICRYQ